MASGKNKNAWGLEAQWLHTLLMRMGGNWGDARHLENEGACKGNRHTMPKNWNISFKVVQLHAMPTALRMG